MVRNYTVLGLVPPPATAGRTVLVADESGLPAAAGILASLPTRRVRAARGARDADRQDLVAPPGVEVRWVVRTDPHDVPGRAAAALAQAEALPDAPFHGWTVGEQALPTGGRRHRVRTGVAEGPHHVLRVLDGPIRRAGRPPGTGAARPGAG